MCVCVQEFVYHSANWLLKTYILWRTANTENGERSSAGPTTIIFVTIVPTSAIVQYFEWEEEKKASACPIHSRQLHKRQSIFSREFNTMSNFKSKPAFYFSQHRLFVRRFRSLHPLTIIHFERFIILSLKMLCIWAKKDVDNVWSSMLRGRKMMSILLCSGKLYYFIKATKQM